MPSLARIALASSKSPGGITFSIFTRLGNNGQETSMSSGEYSVTWSCTQERCRQVWSVIRCLFFFQIRLVQDLPWEESPSLVWIMVPDARCCWIWCHLPVCNLARTMLFFQSSRLSISLVVETSSSLAIGGRVVEAMKQISVQVYSVSLPCLSLTGLLKVNQPFSR